MIKPDKITFKEIRDLADQNRKKYCNDEFPVPIEEIVEFDLGIEVRPVKGMLVSTDLDAVISSDLKVIFVEQTLMDNHRFLFRYRFALAHEMGHYVLHAEKLSNISFSNVDEWVKLRTEFDNEDLMWFERQAMEFGGRLMVPYNPLFEMVSEMSGNIEQYFKTYPDAGYETISSFIAQNINRRFEVSDQVVKRRIINEGILKDLGF